MTQIQTSLHGRSVGLGAENTAGRQLVVPGGLVSGDHGSQIALPSPSMVAVFDDFIGDALDAKWNIVEGTDSATSDAAILAGGIGGVLQFTTGDAGSGLAADMVQMTQALQWQASNGGLVAQARFKLSAITTCYAFFGFTDVTTLEAPIESAASADTLTSNATDAVGIMFDTRMSTDKWWLVGVATDVDATAQNSGYAPVADTYETWRIEVTADGIATFFRNGLQVGTAMTGAVTAGADLTPTFAVSKTSVAASMSSELDYVHVAMHRA
jgi:hypothetical protein